MRAQHATAQNGNTGKRTLPYNRQYVLLAVYEVLDKNDTLAGEISCMDSGWCTEVLSTSKYGKIY